MPPVPFPDPGALLGRYWRHGLTLQHGIVAHESLEAWLREYERDAKWLTSRIPDTDQYIARNVDRGTGTHARFARAELCHTAATMYEQDLVRDQMHVRLDLDAGCKIFVAHYEIRGPTIQAVDFEDEGSFADVTANAAFSLAEL